MIWQLVAIVSDYLQNHAAAGFAGPCQRGLHRRESAHWRDDSPALVIVLHLLRRGGVVNSPYCHCTIFQITSDPAHKVLTTATQSHTAARLMRCLRSSSIQRRRPCRTCSTSQRGSVGRFPGPAARWACCASGLHQRRRNLGTHRLFLGSSCFLHGFRSTSASA